MALARLPDSRALFYLIIGQDGSIRRGVVRLSLNKKKQVICDISGTREKAGISVSGM
jgi:hypothetical protein